MYGSVALQLTEVGYIAFKLSICLWMSLTNNTTCHPVLAGTSLSLALPLPQVQCLVQNVSRPFASAMAQCDHLLHAPWHHVTIMCGPRPEVRKLLRPERTMHNATHEHTIQSLSHLKSKPQSCTN